MSEPPRLSWTDAGAPRAEAFDDIYFSAEDGLAESRAVFLAGLDLPAAWAGRRGYVVGELGFGTGLNVLALIELWRRARSSLTARLDVWSVEAFPLAPDDAARALAAFPELAELAAPLIAGWPRGRRGVHRVRWPEFGVELQLVVGDAQPALDAWLGRADAWMLDGFAPARNPAMWTPDLLAAVAAHSRPGARAATFTVAGTVRRGLEAAGFQVEKRPGFGRKRERLEARLPGAWAEPASLRSVVIVGGGVAGAALALALSGRGREVTVLAADGPGGSRVPSALVTPRLDAGLGPVAQLHGEAFARAVALYGAIPGAVLARGVLQLEAGARDAARFDRLADWNGFASGALLRLTPEAAAAALGETARPGALRFADGLVIDPAVVLDTWLGGVRRVPGDVASVVQTADGLRLYDAAGVLIAQAEAVVLAGGASGATLLPDLPLQPVRGQVELATGALPGAPAAWGGYAAPTREGWLFGATHGRGDGAADLRDDDRARNLSTLAGARPAAHEQVEAATLTSWAGVRLATPDHLPLAGELAPRLHVLTALGGRGFTLAPLLAEHVAAGLDGRPSPLPAACACAVDPLRFGTRGAALRSQRASLEPS